METPDSRQKEKTMCDDNDTFDTTPVDDTTDDTTYMDEIMGTDNSTDPLVWIGEDEYKPRDEDND